MARNNAALRSTQPFDRPVLLAFRRRFAWATVYFTAVLIAGTLGYVSIEGWPLLDAVYMSAITITSVGYSEVLPLSGNGRLFTMALLPFGIIGLGIWWALITALIVETDLGGMLRRQRMTRKLKDLSGHTIVCGAGRMGRVIVRELLHGKRPLLVIDISRDHLEELENEHPDLLTLCADATKEHSLEHARIDSAHGLGACLGDDADNLLLTLTARGLRPELSIVARAYDEESLDKLKRAGATHVISPNVTGAVRMATALVRPAVVSFLDAATVGSDIALRLEQAVVPEGSRLDGMRLADAGIPQRTGLIVLALRRHGGGLPPIFNPGPETRLAAGDVMIALGREDQIEDLRRYAAGDLSVEDA